jgi:hypothetical protein
VHLVQQSLSAERLGDKRRRLVRDALLARHSLAEAGHVQDGQSRPQLDHVLGQCATGHAGQDGVGQQKLEVAGDRQRQGFLECAGLQGGVAILAQNPRGDLQDGWLVIDNQDRLPVSLGVRGGDSRR